jgi:hypothetical protein
MQRPTSCSRLEAVRTAWATDPERIDPDDYPVRTPFARLLTWAHCPNCDLQVHAQYTLFLLQGITCPTCGARLISPPAEASEQLAVALRREDSFSRQLELDAE